MKEETWVGRYQIVSVIGEGAMAHVYLAYDPSIDRRVAIKVLKPEYRSDAELVRRFLAESRAAGMLSHSHIVTIYDVGEADGAPYIAMEHLSGRPLDEILRDEGRLTTERVVSLGLQIAQALSYAHRNGVVHRDVKPSNILICENGATAKLLDFGIARVDARDSARSEQDAQRTQAGQVMGTPRYMSPEQAMGLPLDARSDLFALGAVLYEMTAGKPAFPATGMATLAIQITQERHVPVPDHVRDCPRGLAFIIDKLLAKKPGARFADTQSLVKALEREQDALTQDADPPRRALALRVKLPLTLAVTTALALLASVTLVLDRQSETMIRMAVSSGRSMTDFVASNAALRFADNAGLPAARQDWLPLQIFVDTAARDGTVKRLIIMDDKGIVRAAGDRKLIGSRFDSPSLTGPELTAQGIHFVRPVEYAGAPFGTVDMVMDRSAVDEAMQRARMLLAALAVFIVMVIALTGYWSARQLSVPLRRLRKAIGEAAEGNFAFRLSHRRNDEMGRLFDAFNHMAREMEATRGNGGPVADAQAILRTRIAQSPSPDEAGSRAA